MKINSDQTYSDFEIISHEISFTKNSLEFYSVHQLGSLYYWTVRRAWTLKSFRHRVCANLSNLYRSNQAICH